MMAGHGGQHPVGALFERQRRPFFGERVGDVAHRGLLLYPDRLLSSLQILIAIWIGKKCGL
jgi:hypothetical protein